MKAQFEAPASVATDISTKPLDYNSLDIKVITLKKRTSKISGVNFERFSTRS